MEMFHGCDFNSLNNFQEADKEQLWQLLMIILSIARNQMYKLYDHKSTIVCQWFVCVHAIEDVIVTSLSAGI